MRSVRGGAAHSGRVFRRTSRYEMSADDPALVGISGSYGAAENSSSLPHQWADCSRM